MLNLTRMGLSRLKLQIPHSLSLIPNPFVSGQKSWLTLLIQQSFCINNFIEILHNKKKFKAIPSIAVKAISTSAAAATMVKAIRVHELGDHQVLKWEDVQIGEPKDGEIRVKNKAIGVNFIDIYFRKGVYNVALPFTPGMEAVGVVEAVGPGLTGRKVGDIVAYASSPMGSYAEEQILPADKVVPVPPSIDPIVAAAVMSKGMTAQFLVRRCFKVVSGHTVLVHAAAGGVGSLLCQCANALGATVIGTVSTKEKAAQAKDDGCHHVILYKEEDFVTRVNKITSGKGVEVVYDSVGKDTFQGISIRLMTKPTSILDNTHLVILTDRWHA